MVCNKKVVLKDMGGYNYHVTIVWLMVIDSVIFQ
jgi:hypothetical protein